MKIKRYKAILLEELKKEYGSDATLRVVMPPKDLLAVIRAMERIAENSAMKAVNADRLICSIKNEEELLEKYGIPKTSELGKSILEMMAQYRSDISKEIDTDDYGLIDEIMIKYPPSAEKEEKAIEIVCPFCNETGFDTGGLKYHLQHHCNDYNNVPDIHTSKTSLDSAEKDS